MDFIGSVVVFMLLMIGIISFWNVYGLRFNANLEQEELTLKIVKITDVFIQNQGVPTGWNETNVAVIGLVNSDRKLDEDKLSSFKNMTYDNIKELLNIEAYEFYFRVIDTNGALIKANGQFIEIGNLPDFDVKNIIKIRRIALYGIQQVIVEFSMWKK
mgnify:FL=1